MLNIAFYPTDATCIYHILFFPRTTKDRQTNQTSLTKIMTIHFITWLYKEEKKSLLKRNSDVLEV